MALAMIAAYLVVVIALRLDRLFLPGNELHLPQAFQMVPGLQAETVASQPFAERITVLVLGLDRRPSEGNEPTRSDSMFVMTLDPVAHTGAVLSIPRDLWVEVPNGRGGYFEDRINTAYRYGGLTPYPGGSVQAARDVIEHNFPQIHLDYVVAIDFTSFISIIDTLGGVDINVTEPFRYTERVSVDDRDGVLPEYHVGVEHMSGVRALYYSRYREGPDGDFGRIRRQQQVMMAVANRAISTDAIAHVPDLYAKLKGSIETDVPAYRVPGLGLLARQVGLDHVTMRSLGEVTKDAVTAGGADVLVADPADLARVVNDLFFDPSLRAEAATVEVQNATVRAGLATAAADYLVLRGLPGSAVTVARTAPAPQDETAILASRGKEYTARRLAEWLGVSPSRIRLSREPAGTGTGTATATPALAAPDIVVVLGRDAKVPGSAAPLAGGGTGPVTGR